MKYSLLSFFVDFIFVGLPVTATEYLFLIFTLSDKKDDFIETCATIVFVNTFVFYILTFGNYGDLTETLFVNMIISIAFIIHSGSNKIFKTILYGFLSLLIIMISQAVLVVPISILFNIEIARFSTDLPIQIFIIIFSTFFQFLVLFKMYLIKKVRIKCLKN